MPRETRAQHTAMQSHLFTNPLFAAGGGVTVDVDLTMVAHMVLFTAFVLMISEVLFKPLLRVFEERRRRTRGAVDKAREMDERAIALKQDFDEKMDDIRRKAGVDREKARKDNAALESEFTEKSRSAAQKSLDAGMAKINGEVARIRQELEAQRQVLAAEIASRVLGREVEK